MTVPACEKCFGAADWDVGKVAQIKFGAWLCPSCYDASRWCGYAVKAATCATCRTRYREGARCPRCRVVDEVGAEVFECACGERVPIGHSVRMMRKPAAGRGTQIERVCRVCSEVDGCRPDEHTLVTRQNPGFEQGRIPFQPLPDDFPVAYCSTCNMTLHWTGQRWARMTWTTVADAWGTLGT